MNRAIALLYSLFSGVEIYLYCIGTERSRLIAVLYRYKGEYCYSCTVQGLRGIEVWPYCTLTEGFRGVAVLCRH